MERLRLVNENDGTSRISFNPIFRLSEESIRSNFHPSRSNIHQAYECVRKLIKKYKSNPGVLNQAQELMKKEEDEGKLIVLEPGTDLYNQIMNNTHYFAFPNVVFNPDSILSPTRVIVDSSRKIPGMQATVSMLVETLENSLGNMMHAILAFRLFDHAFAADVRKCYHQFLIEGT